MEIRFYKNVNGNAPVEEYLDGLLRKLREKTLRSIALLKAYGHTLREPESKYLEDGIFELRSTFGGDTGRVLFFSMKAARFSPMGLKRKVEKLRAVK